MEKAAAKMLRPAQLSVLKDPKFCGHGLNQFENVLKMLEVLIATREQKHQDGDENASEKETFLANDKFKPQMALLTDWLDLFKKWSFVTQVNTHLSSGLMSFETLST